MIRAALLDPKSFRKAATKMATPRDHRDRDPAPGSADSSKSRSPISSCRSGSSGRTSEGTCTSIRQGPTGQNEPDDRREDRPEPGDAAAVEEDPDDAGEDEHPEDAS